MDAPTSSLAAVVIGAALALLPSTGAAQTTGTLDESIVSARTMGLGGGTIAAASSTSALYSNPGAMALAHVYHVDSDFLYDPGAHRWTAGGAIVDSSRTFGAGLAYHYNSVSNGADDRGDHDVRLGLSMALAEGIGLGVTGRYVNYGGAATTNGKLGTSFAGFTLDAGLVVRPVHFLSLGATAYSLTDPDTTLSPFSIGGGAAVFPFETLTLVADAIFDMHSYAHPRARWSGGVELMAGRVPLRMGYIYDDGRGTQAVTAGLGYLDQAFGIEASLRQEVSGGSQTTMMLALRYFYRLL